MNPSWPAEDYEEVVGPLCHDRWGIWEINCDKVALYLLWIWDEGSLTEKVFRSFPFERAESLWTKDKLNYARKKIMVLLACLFFSNPIFLKENRLGLGIFLMAREVTRESEYTFEIYFIQRIMFGLGLIHGQTYLNSLQHPRTIWLTYPLRTPGREEYF